MGTSRSATGSGRVTAHDAAREPQLSAAPASADYDRRGSLESDEPHPAEALGGNLRRIRVQRGLSLERLARSSGVSRAMLGQVELGKSIPSITVLWKVTRALEVPLSALLSEDTKPHPVQLLRRSDGKRVVDAHGRFTLRPLFTESEPGWSSFFELRLGAAATESVAAQPYGTREQVVVASGELEIVVSEEVHRLAAGDVLLFAADTPYTYRNAGRGECYAYLVRSAAIFPS